MALALGIFSAITLRVGLDDVRLRLASRVVLFAATGWLLLTIAVVVAYWLAMRAFGT
jgi:hypothetical protein